MKVDGSLGPLIQGVSQQPPQNRLPGQCSEQINMTSNPVDGLSRRPPLNELKAFMNAGQDVQFLDFTLGNTSWIAAVGNDSFRVFDLEGEEQAVIIRETGGVPDTVYFDGSRVTEATIDQTVFFVNRTSEVKMLNTTADLLNRGSIVYWLGGGYGRTYKISIEWDGADIDVSWTTPDGSQPSHITQVASTYIAEQLEDALNGDSTFSSNFEVTRSRERLYIKKTSSPENENFIITVEDGVAGTHMFVCNNAVNDIGVLPSTAPQDYVVRIKGTAQASADDWYVKWECVADNDGDFPAKGEGFGRDGQWRECQAPDIEWEFDTGTMPHILEWDEDEDSFVFSRAPWEGRRVGDEETNENPSFVGEVIEDIGYFQGRLVVLSTNAVITTRTNKPYDFWRNSATALVATDPIDIKSTIRHVQKMYRLVPYDRDMVIFSDRGQFVMSGRTTLTPSTASLVLTTQFEAALDADPVASGSSVYFDIKYGVHCGVREFFTQDGADANDSRPVTQQVLRYILGPAAQLVSSSNFDVLVLRSVARPKELYVYEYLWVDSDKVQASWSRWTFPMEIMHMFMLASKMYLVYQVNGRFTLGSIDIDVPDDDGLTYTVHLDRKIKVAGIHDHVDDPYEAMPDPEQVVFIQGEDCPYPGMRVVPESYTPPDGNDPGYYSLYEDLDGGTVLCGVPYMSLYRPTVPIIKDSDGVKVGSGRLKISKFRATVRNTGKLFSRVFNRFGVDHVTEHSGRFVGDDATVVGQPAIFTGDFVLPFRNNADISEIEMFTDEHTPWTLLNMEWDGQYTKRGSRITQGNGGQ